MSTEGDSQITLRAESRQELCAPVERSARRDTPEVGAIHWLDHVTVWMQRSWIEAKQRDHPRMAVVAVVRVPDQRLEERGVRSLDALEHGLALVGTQRDEVGARLVLYFLKSASEERFELVRRGRDGDHVVERHGARSGELAARGHER